jgi:membrane protein CcdC involved in cytochrome C biogenesis
MEYFLKIIGYLSIPLVLLSVFWMIRGLRKQRRLTQKSLIIQMLFSPIFLLVYSLLLKVPVSQTIATTLLIVGLVIGVLWGNTTRLQYRDNQVFGQRSIWYLVIWALSFSITQVLALIARSGIVAIGLSTMFFSTGGAIGMNAYLLYRYSRMVSHGTRETTCPGCGSQNDLGVNYCIHCGKSLVTMANVSSNSSMVTCPNCSSSIESGLRYCTQCGKSVN